MKRMLALMLIMASCAAFAEVYVNHTDSGTEYTDTPSANSQPVAVPPVNTITSAPAPIPSAAPSSGQTITPGATATTPADDDPATIATNYTSFEIITPKPEETIQNQPIVSIAFKVEPKLAPTDKIQVLLDNQPVGTPSGMLYQEIKIEDRGTHSLSAIIVNNNNQTLKKAPAITIYVHRNSTLTSPATANQSSNEGQTSLQTLFESIGTASG